MEERSDHLEVLASNESNSKKCSERESSSSTCRPESSDLSMPICFLVKEQAKSLVIIQDLKERVENIENIQDDVIDSLAEIRNFLCNESKTYSGLNLGSSSLLVSNETPSNQASKAESFSKSLKFVYSPSIKDVKCISLKDCRPHKPSTSLQASEHSEKQFESKTKDSQLESDKQDSGLDSDHLSLNKPSNNWGKQESGDELLQLLDEISERTEVLQKQLSDIDQKSISDLSPHHMSRSVKIRSKTDPKESGKTYAGCLNCSKRTTASVAGLCVQENMTKMSSEEPPECFSGRKLSDRVHRREKRAGNKIDSAMVSSILKETNVVDLQRQVLIYLVENAVLHTKLNELEQLVASKSLENNKIESNLKDETRLLMMENRELRISLDEQKLETNALRSKVIMMERVLQSISVENRELTWQLGESLGIQNLSRKEPRKFSSSYTFGNPTTSKVMRRPSLPSQFTESNVNCVKSKLLSNTSSFLDVTVEEPEHPWPAVHTPAPLDRQSGTVQSSTPMAPSFTKLKDVKAGIGSPTSSASNFQSVKKRFKTTEKDTVFKNCNSDIDPEEGLQDTRYETCISRLKLNASNFENSSTQFPFSTILEKLKANSDYRLSRRTSLAHTNEGNFSAKATSTQSKFATSQEVAPQENLRPSCYTPTNKKGKNIHQRIQDILDRIMSESEEAS